MTDVTGSPQWERARETAARLREMPQGQAEANVQAELKAMLQALFPRLPPSELTLEKQTGAGRIDVYCRNVVFESKKQGKLDARRKPDGSSETPEEQAVRYLDALSAQPADMFTQQGVGWRACTTDGKQWQFYDYDRDRPQADRLVPLRQLHLTTPADDDALVSFLHDFVDRVVKLAPPADNREWVESLAQPFADLAAEVDHENSRAYGVKRDLWRDLLRGAYITPPERQSDAERDLFARHTMLVVMSRAVAETVLPATDRPHDRDQRHDALTQGFSAWLLDAAGARGAERLDKVIEEVNCYDWQSGGRDTLKDLYHTAIPRDIRHDFGEYYTPDWLARAVCEEVMDAQWRKDVIDLAVARKSADPAVIDPSCGSGTFLYHATQLLLEDARKHPELASSPEAIVETVNGLVVGIDLHPVAVELAKTTKTLAFADLA